MQENNRSYNTTSSKSSLLCFKYLFISQRLHYDDILHDKPDNKNLQNKMKKFNTQLAYQ